MVTLSEHLVVAYASGPDDGGTVANWSSRDKFLTEKQMLASRRYGRALWSYTRMDGPNHWLQLDAPERFNPLLLDSLCRSGEEGTR